MKALYRPCSFVHFATLLVMGIFVALCPLALQAATIPVNTTTPGVVVDGQCGLAEAIIAANTNTASDSCVAGDDALVDTIVLEVDATYPLIGAYADYNGPTGLPSITSSLVISGNNATIERSSS